MSGSKQDKLDAIKKAAHDKWVKGSEALQSLDKDVWHNIKKDANVKKTKWFQSGSNIGPKITKAQSAGTAFGKDMSLSNYKSVEKSLAELSKECKDFWNKHKDAPQDNSVQTALKIYDEAARDGLKALKEIEKSMEVLEQISRQSALNRGTEGMTH